MIRLLLILTLALLAFQIHLFGNWYLVCKSGGCFLYEDRRGCRVIPTLLPSPPGSPPPCLP